MASKGLTTTKPFLLPGEGRAGGLGAAQKCWVPFLTQHLAAEWSGKVPSALVSLSIDQDVNAYDKPSGWSRGERKASGAASPKRPGGL